MAARKKSTAKAKRGSRNNKSRGRQSAKVRLKPSSDKFFAALKKMQSSGDWHLRLEIKDGDDA